MIAVLNSGYAQPTDATKEIDQAIRDYLAAMSARDVDGLQAVLDKHLVLVEAGDKNAKVHAVNVANGMRSGRARTARLSLFPQRL